MTTNVYGRRRASRTIHIEIGIGAWAVGGGKGNTKGMNESAN